MTKKLLALLLVLVMCLSLVPFTVVTAMATETIKNKNILPEDFPADKLTAWVCESDRNKVIYKNGDNLIIGSYDSGQFNKQGFNCSTASEVTWNENGFYYCEPEGYGTVKFNMESNVLKSITIDSGSSSIDGTYSPVTIENILPEGFPTSANFTWKNSGNDDVCVYRDGDNLIFYGTEVAVPLSSLLTRAEYTCTFVYTGEGDGPTIQFNMTDGYGAELENIVVTYCFFTNVVGTYTPPEETVSYTVTYDANGATSGSVPTDSTKYTSGASVTVEDNTGKLAKDGYSFDGWNTKSDGTGTPYAAGSNFSITEDTTLYAKWKSVGSHAHGEGDKTIAFDKKIKTVDDLKNLFTDGGSAYLGADITLENEGGLTVSADKPVDLCLNSHVLDLNGKGNIRVDDGATLNLYDCGEKGKITGGNATYGGGVYVEGTFNMSGGNITGNTATRDSTGCGGGVYVTGTFNMSGGNITGNTATGGSAGSGGGVYVASFGTFNMTGGNITGNNVKTTGGGVYVHGEDAEHKSEFYMTGGNITGNTAATFGGGVYVVYSIFTMSGGNIVGNNANVGGGVNAAAGAEFTMTDGSISGNTATNGGGVCNAVPFEMTGGSISGNTATTNGGGVYASDTVTLGGTAKITGNVKGGTIENNLYLPKNKTVTLGTGTDAPTTMSVGVTMATPGTFTGTATETQNGYFSSDNSGYEVAFNTDHLELTKTVAPTYAITNGTVEGDKGTNHGYITIDPTSAASGTDVTVTVTPDEGYALKTLKYNDGEDHTITVDKDGKYTFTMPAKAVTVTAEFELGDDDDGGDLDYETLAKAGLVAAGVVTGVVVTKIVVDKLHEIEAAKDAAAEATPVIKAEEMPMVAIGSTGDAVTTLQTKLNKLGYNCGEVDGVFGQNTLNAVIAFQTAKGLTADGVVGRLTWDALL